MQYLAILKLEDKRSLGAGHGLADDLGSNPALGGIRLPRSRADIVVLCHLEMWKGWCLGYRLADADETEQQSQAGRMSSLSSGDMHELEWISRAVWNEKRPSR